MEPHILTSCTGHLDDEVSAGDEVAELGERLGEDAAVVEVFGLAEDEVEAVEGTLQTQVAAHDSDIVRHDFLKLFLGLCDEDHLLVEDHTLGVPVRYLAFHFPLSAFH